MVSPGVHGTVLITNLIFSLRAKLAAVPPELSTVPEVAHSTSACWHGQG